MTFILDSSFLHFIPLHLTLDIAFVILSFVEGHRVRVPVTFSFATVI